jgi:hypothetical protein
MNNIKKIEFLNIMISNNTRFVSDKTILKLNMNSEQGLKLNVRGDLIEIPSYAILHIPFIKILSETKSDDIIKIDAISPKFLNYILEYIKNQQQTSYLKTRLTIEFEEQTIKDNLMYLAMDKLLDKLFNSFYNSKHMINNMPVIESFTFSGCKMRGGQLIPFCDIDLMNTLILLSKDLIEVYVENSRQIYLVFYDKIKKTKIYPYLDSKLFIKENDSWFMRVAHYCMYDLPLSDIFTKK